MAQTPRPPDELDGVIDQVADALDELEIVEGAERNALLSNLRDVLGALDGFGTATLTVHAEAPEPEPPDISVLEGGRSEETAAGASRARLRIAPDADPGPAEEGVRDEDTQGSGAREHTRLSVRRFPLPPRRSEPPLNEPPGAILLVPAVAGAAEQTLLLGSELRAYRIRCTHGEMQVLVDDAPAFSLVAGQTVDVEGRRLRVAAAGAAEGRYIRLGTPATR
jgi:hypothetical protein